MPAANLTEKVTNAPGEVIKSFQSSVPVDVIGIAEELGIWVYDAHFPDDISGKITKDPVNAGPSGFSILVNEDHVETRKRFTIAHEIAHYILHRNRIGSGLTDNAMYRSGLSTLEEVQANRLAADILMPFNLIEQEMNKGNETLDDLASVFKVSRDAMSIRIGLPY